MLGLVAFDDLDAREKVKTVAVAHHRLVLDDQEIELDLSAEHDEELTTFLARYFGVRGAKPGSSESFGPGGVFQERRDYLTAFRKWADAQEPPVRYKSDKGNGYYYPVPAMRRFDKYMEEQLGGLGSD